MTKKTAFQKAKALLEAEVRDKVTGYTGKCTGVALYAFAYDTIQCRVEKLTETGEHSYQWIEHTRLEVVNAATEEE